MMTKKQMSLWRDQTGAALVIALIMIVVLTLIGLASTFTSNFEIKISGNKRGSTDAFYTADSGAQAVLVDVNNFNLPGNFVAVTQANLPTDLRHESIDTRFTNPTPAWPAGVNFTTPPQVTVYHTTLTGVPRGTGLPADGSIEFEHYVLDSIGADQMDVDLLRSTVQIRERVVRLIPTAQGGN